ncbi:immunoglobulin domain-containing protein oig-4-like [Paramacrobiotus metropolitanus]|uniref:immunoglobulin domain-containing protein oig-4-like n=1 Tax=Paramacrobiotus metropolitanus TaxID=2943436 RepID=UPI0024456DF3|nr:immunoglobulin domain-containing protein oig-4-like [Paramacrobiotus metropolitanus]
MIRIICLSATVILFCCFLSDAARPWRYDVPQERKNYDTQWVYRPYQERLDKYYSNPNGARIIKQSHFAYEYRLGHKLQFLCIATGNPLPRITWLKDGLELISHKNLVIHEWKLKGRKNRGKDDDEGKKRIKSKLEIDPTTQGDQGIYSCIAENKFAIEERKFKAEFVAN